MGEILQVFNLNALNALIQENDADDANYFNHKMKKRVSKDKPAYLNEKNNLLDHNCTLNRYKLNDFRSSIEFLDEPCEHSHPIHEACFPSCKLHPFNRRYPGTHSLIKMNFIDNISGIMMDKITELTIFNVSSLRGFLSTNSIWLTSKVLEAVFEKSRRLIEKRLGKNGFHIYSNLLYATFSRIVDVWNVFKICKKFMGSMEYDSVVNFFGENCINDISKMKETGDTTMMKK